MNSAPSTMVPSMHNQGSIGLIVRAHIYSVNRCRACIPCCTIYLHLHTFPDLLPLLSRAFPLCVFLTSYIQVGSNLSASRLGCLQPCPQTPTPMLTPRPCRAWVKACLTSQRRAAPTWIGMVCGQKCIAAALCCACDQCLPLLHQRAHVTALPPLTHPQRCPAACGPCRRFFCAWTGFVNKQTAALPCLQVQPPPLCFPRWPRRCSPTWQPSATRRQPTPSVRNAGCGLHPSPLLSGLSTPPPTVAHEAPAAVSYRICAFAFRGGQFRGLPVVNLPFALAHAPCRLPGRPCKEAVDLARRQVAAMVGAESDEIHFTSCGTEADAW